MALEVVINGQLRSFEELGAGATVLELIATLGLEGDRIALELNGDIAARAAWGKTELMEKDKVEIVHFVGGGSSEIGFYEHRARADLSSPSGHDETVSGW